MMTEFERNRLDMLAFEFFKVKEEYQELVDALCSKSWTGRGNHESVVALAKRLKNSQQKLFAKGGAA